MLREFKDSSFPLFVESGLTIVGFLFLICLF